MHISDIGKRILFLREERGYSQKELSELVPISQSTLSRWEKGAVVPPLPQLEKICDVLGVSLEQVFEGDKTEYEKIKKRLSRFKLFSLTMAVIVLFLVIVMLVPKYRVVKEGDSYMGDYGQTLTVYVEPVFFLGEKSAFSYGQKVAKRYYDSDEFSVVEVVFIKSFKDLYDEDNVLCTYIYFLKALYE